ncbi:MAG: hypothetical protein IJX35_04080 [Candidatus Methanomethylophilaceae archaeon]|nr:hypothetical protein [Candidatus Methanomethylophilaceae archaeon]
MADEEKPATSYAQSKDPYAKKGKDKGLGSIIGGNLKNIIPKEPEILSENPRAPAPSGVPPTQKERDDILKQVNDKFGGKGGAGGGQPAAEAGKVKPPEVKEIELIQAEKPLGPVKVDTSTIEHNEKAPEESKMENEAPENPAETPEEGDGKGGMGIVDRIKEFHEDPFRGALTENDREEARHEAAQEAQDRGGTVSPSDMMSKKDVREANQAYAESQNPQEDVKSEEEPDEKLENPVTEEDYTVKYGQVAVDSAKRWGKLLALPVAQGILDSNFGDNTVAAFDSTRKILRSFLTGNPMSAASTILGESVNNLNRFSDTADKIGERMGIAVGADPTLLEGTIVGRSFKRRADEDRQATSAALKVVDDAMTSLGEDSLENLTPEKLTQFYDTIGQANSQAVSTLKRYFDGDETVTKRDRDLALRQIEVYGSVMDDITKKSKQDKEKYAADAAWLRKVGSNRNRMEKMRQEIQHKRRYDSATDLGKLSIDLLGRNVLLNQAGEPVRKNDITRMKNTLEAKLASNELSPEDRTAYQKALDRITQLATPYDEVQWQKMLDETTDKGRIIATLTSKRIPVDKNGSYDSFHANTVARRAREYITTHPDISDEDRKLYEEIADEAEIMSKTSAQLKREMEARELQRKLKKANPVQREMYRVMSDNQIKNWNLDKDGIPAAPGQMRQLATALKNEIAGGGISKKRQALYEQTIDTIEERMSPGREQANRRYAAELDLNNVTDPSGNVHLKFIHGALDTRRDIRFDLNTGLPASASDYQSLSRQIENTLNDPEKLSRLSGSMAPDTVKSELEYYKNNILDPAMRKDYQVRADDKRAKATPEQMRVYNLLDDRQVAEWNLDANGMPGSKTQKRNLRTRIENALLDPSIPDSEKAALKAMRDEITKGLRTEFERSNEEYRASLYNDPDTKNLGYVYDTLTRFKGIRFDPDTKLPASPRDYAKLESSIRNAMKDPEYLKNHPAIGKASTEAILQSYLDKKLLPAMRSQRAKDYEEWKKNAQDDNVRLLGEALGGEKGTIDIKPDGSIAKGRRAAAIRKIQDYLFNSDLPADDPGRQYLADKAAKWQQAIDVENMDKRATVKKRKILEDDTKSISERLGALWDVDDVALESVTGKALSAHQVDSSANKAALMQTAYMKKNYPLVYNALTEYDSIDEMASDGPEMNDDELREEAKRLLADPMYIANQHAVDNLRMASDTQRYQKMIHNAGQAMQLNPQEIQRDIDRLSVLSYQTIQSKSEDPTKVGEYIPLSADSPYQKELDALMDKYNLRGKFKASGKKGAVNLGPVAVDDEKVDNKDGIHFFFSDYTQNNMANIAIQINNYYGTGAYSSGPASAKGGVKFGAGYTSEEPSEESPETPVTPEPEKEKGEKPEQEQSDKTKIPSKGMFAKQTHYRESDDAQEDPRGAFSIDDGKGGFRPMSKDEVSKLKGRVEAAKKSKDINEVKAMLDELDSTIHFSGDELDKRSQFYSDKYMEYYGKERPTTGKYSDYIDSRIYGVDGGFSNAKKILISREELQQKYDQLLAEENAKKEAEAREAHRQQDELDAGAAINEFGDVLSDDEYRTNAEREGWRERNRTYWDDKDENAIDEIFNRVYTDETAKPESPVEPETDEEQVNEEKSVEDETIPPVNPNPNEKDGKGEGEVPPVVPPTDEAGEGGQDETEEISEEEKKQRELADERTRQIGDMKKGRRQRHEKLKKNFSEEDLKRISSPEEMDGPKGIDTQNIKRVSLPHVRNVGDITDAKDGLEKILKYDPSMDPQKAERYLRSVLEDFDTRLIEAEIENWKDQARLDIVKISEDDIKKKVNPLYAFILSNKIPQLAEKAEALFTDEDGNFSVEKYENDWLEKQSESEEGGETVEQPKPTVPPAPYFTSNGTAPVGSGSIVDEDEVAAKRAERQEFDDRIKEIQKDKDKIVSTPELQNDEKFFKDISSIENPDEESIQEVGNIRNKYLDVLEAYTADATRFAGFISTYNDTSLSGELAEAYFGGNNLQSIQNFLNKINDKMKVWRPTQTAEPEKVETPAEEKPTEEKPVEPPKPKRTVRKRVKVEPVADEPPVSPVQETKIEEPEPKPAEPSGKNYQVPSLEAIENAFHPNEAKQNRNDWEYYENLAKNPEKVKKVEEIYTNACELLNNLHAEVLNGRMSKEDAEKEIKQKTGHELGTLYRALGKLKGFIGDSGVDKDTLPRFPLKFGVAEEISGNENDAPLIKRSIRVKKYQDEGDGDLHILQMDLPDTKTINRFIGPDSKNVNPTEVKRAKEAYENMMDRIYAIKHFYDITDKGKQTRKLKSMFFTRRDGKEITSDNVMTTAWELYDMLKARGQDVEEPYLPRPVKKVKKITKSMSSRDAMRAIFEEKAEEHNARFEAYDSVEKRRFTQ